MDSPLTLKDHQIFEYMSENFSCKICDHILIQCMTLSCGHHYCKYCLDLLLGGSKAECPECSTHIQYARPNNCIDKKIDNLIRSCSDPLQDAFEAALDARFKKTLDRHKKKRNHQQSHQSKTTSCADEICQEFTSMNVNLDVENCVGKVLKSARNAPSTMQRAKTARGHGTGPIVTRPSTAFNSNSKTQSKTKRHGTSEVDTNKVNTLFGIYGHVMNGGNEPEKDMAGGDFTRPKDIQTATRPRNPPDPQVKHPGLKNFTKRNQTEIASLIKEADDLVRLENHIQHWSKKMKDAVCGNKSSQKSTPEDGGLTGKDGLSEDTHKIDDELRKATAKLLKKIRGMQKQCHANIDINDISILGRIAPPPLPVPRSNKLDPDAISEDSEAEEYERALDGIREFLDTQ